jgi:outer membrane protein OmpA-like peptidoglycan-associated protein
MAERSESRGVAKEELKSGVKLQAGHAVELLVGGIPGSAAPDGEGEAAGSGAGTSPSAEGAGAGSGPAAGDGSGEGSGDGTGASASGETADPAPEPKPNKVIRARLTGLHFETDKSFLLPGGIVGMRGLKRLLDARPGAQLLVTGHTDRAGDDAYNLTLSVERARAIAAYLRDRAEDWVRSYSTDLPQNRRWGTREDQHMLHALSGDAGPDQTLAPPGEPYYDGAIDGIAGPKTEAALRAFQTWSNARRGTSLEVDGKAGKETRTELILVYMSQPETTVAEEPAVHGCGEFHNEVPTADGVEEPRNRRVEVFFFEDGIDPPPQDRCPGPSGCSEYPQWSAKVGEEVDLSQPPANLTLTLVDDQGASVGQARVVLSGPVPAEGTTDDAGVARFEDLFAGAYDVTAERPGFQTLHTQVQVGEG